MKVCGTKRGRWGRGWRVGLLMTWVAMVGYYLAISTRSPPDAGSFGSVKQVSPPATVRVETPRAVMPLEAFNASLCCGRYSTNILHADPTRACDIQGRLRRTLVREPLSVHAMRHAAVLAGARRVVVELGVEHAESAADFGRAAREGSADVWLYDTFAGLPGVSKEDNPMAAGRKGKFKGSEENAVGQWAAEGVARERITLRKGLFQDTVAVNPPPRDSVVVLHADGDLYASVRASLRLHTSVAPGGAVIIDDWWGGHTGAWESARKAVYDFMVEEGQCPLLRTPVFGAAAHWTKQPAHVCSFPPGLRRGTVKDFDQPKIVEYKMKVQALMVALDATLKPWCDAHYTDGGVEAPASFPAAPSAADVARTLERFVGVGEGGPTRLCHGDDGDDHAMRTAAHGVMARLVDVGPNCESYDTLLAAVWKRVPQGDVIMLNCWEASRREPQLGCRQAFGSFVWTSGLMPHLQTLHEVPFAWWIKAPLPLG